MEGFLVLGFFVGLSHALEADHLAAVGALAAEGKVSSRRMIWLGASWGMGHTTTLLLACLPVVLLGFAVSARIEAGMEFFVGVLLVVLGASVAVRLRRQKVHFHLHEHDHGKRHFHAHSHANASVPHTEDAHQHLHTEKFSIKSFLVGSVHGVAGSAGLIALTAAATQNAWVTMSYILVFGLGSILGMATLSFAASWPLRRAETAAARLFTTIQAAVAVGAVALGLSVMFENGPVVLGVG